MSRHFEHDSRDFDERDRSQSEPASHMRLSQGRSGSSASEHESVPEDFDLDSLRRRIDQAAEGGPALVEFLDRLEKSEVHPIASIQSNGRWNGISYHYAGVRVRGSELGRAYTALGLRKRKGIDYDPARDDARLRSIASKPREQHPRDERPNSHPGSRDKRGRNRPDISLRQEQILWEAGRFRTVAASDLARTHYGGNHAALDRDLHALARLRLIDRQRISVDNQGQTIAVVSLTREGKRLLKKSGSASEQAIYAGLVKPREVAHDASLYRMYLAEARRIEANGGRVRRIILDYELKKRAYSPLAKAKQDLPPFEYAERQQEIAKDNDLSVVDGHLILPDLRLEYETPDGEIRHIDLELATRNYRAAHIHSKSKAGFKVYVDSTSKPLSAVLDEHDLIAELLRF